MIFILGNMSQQQFLLLLLGIRLGLGVFAAIWLWVMLAVVYDTIRGR